MVSCSSVAVHTYRREFFALALPTNHESLTLIQLRVLFLLYQWAQLKSTQLVLCKDLSMWNGDFSQSCPPGGVNFSLQRINQLELAVLNSLKFSVKVPASEYAKYYFLLRSMLIKSGLGGEDLGSLDPLDVEGARRLQQVSSQFESRSLMKSDTSSILHRTQSLANQSDRNPRVDQQPKMKVGLEQVVKM